MFSSLFSVFSAFLLGFSHLVNAAPVSPVEYLAFGPTITSPTNATVWHPGSKQNITWETTNVPSEAHNYTLVFLLGQLANNSENLDIKNPLASQVPIMDGIVTIIVPSKPDDNNYIVAAIGDSGDVTAPFTITSS